jgi:RNA polymerase sigma factor (sigma-70 family)
VANPKHPSSQFPLLAAQEQKPLLPRIALGDELATRTFIKRYGGLVMSLARRHAGEDAEDAVQDIFLELWRLAARYDETQGSEVTFIAMVARRRLIDRRRAKQRRPTEPLEPHEESLTSSGTIHETSHDAKQAARVMEQLPPIQQQVIRLSVLEDASHGEIAEALSLPLGTVKSYIRRGLDLVRAAMSNDSKGTL